MKRRFRLTNSSDFKRVRRSGKSFAHPLIVLVVIPNTEQKIRIGVAAGRVMGNAVRRNFAKRKMREAVRPLLPEMKPGWDVILIARKPLLLASFEDVVETVKSLLYRAGLIKEMT